MLLAHITCHLAQQKLLVPTPKNRRQKASKAVSPMTSLAAEIATEAAHKTRPQSRKMSPTT